MKCHIITAALAVAFAAPLCAQDPAAKAPTAEKEAPFPNNVLQQAIANMSQLKGYHVKAELTTPVGKAGLEGDLGVGALSLKGQDPRGNSKLRVAVGGVFYLSTDGGATWKTGEAADKGNTILFSRLVTGPIEPSIKVWEKAEFKASEEKIDGEDLLRVEKPASGKEPAAIFWLVKEPEIKGTIFVRKASMVIAADDGDFPIVVTYTKLNSPAEIKAPIVK